MFKHNNIPGKITKRKGGAFSNRGTLWWKGKCFGSGKVQFYAKFVEEDFRANENLKQVFTVRLPMTKQGPSTVYRLQV